MAVATYIEQSLAKLEQFEGSIPWMYRDTVGKVTVAVGMMLPGALAACELPFLIGGRPASAAEIAAEFARVEALPMGRPALFYRGPNGAHSNPELAQSEIDALLRKILTDFEAELCAYLPSYDSFPENVKLALLDMAYNLGPAGLMHGYPQLLKAVRSANWAQAAAACYRRGPGAARNEWTRQMFLSSVIADVKAAADGLLARLGYGLVGAGAHLVELVKRRVR